MRIGELAQLAGVSPRMVRHYHALGILAEPPRTASGYRDYGPADLLRVLGLRQLASLGFSLARAAQMIDGVGESADDALARLDEALAAQVAQLERQRALVARLRAGALAADVPPEAEGALRALEEFFAVVGEPCAAGALADPLLSGDAQMARLALHLYAPGELAELERVLRAIMDRGLVGEYRSAEALVAALPPDASEAARRQARDACLALLSQIADCLDPDNWDRPEKDYELFLDALVGEAHNEAQRAVCDEVFAALARRMARPPRS